MDLSQLESKETGWTAPTLSELNLKPRKQVIPHDLSAISVGLLERSISDLDYILDSNADVDMNVVGTSNGKFVELELEKNLHLL